jgi:hypothetical protein
VSPIAGKGRLLSTDLGRGRHRSLSQWMVEMKAIICGASSFGGRASVFPDTPHG